MTTNQTLANEARAEARRLAENYGRGYANAQRLLTALADALERQAGVTWEERVELGATTYANVVFGAALAYPEMPPTGGKVAAAIGRAMFPEYAPTESASDEN